jgi:hypothetical protein
MKPSDLGGLLVSFAASRETSGQMTEHLREIHDEFIRNRDAEGSYFLMGFLAAKAIERCSQLEGSNDRITGDRDRGPAAADRAGTGEPPAQPEHPRPADTPAPPPAD